MRKGKDSFYKYRKAIPQVCSQNGFLYPITEPCIIDNIAIVGNIGWYDYTLADSRLTSTYNFMDYVRGTFEEGSWNDTKYAVWLKNPDSTNVSIMLVKTVIYYALELPDLVKPAAWLFNPSVHWDLQENPL